MAKQLFAGGDKVEVSCDERGFRGAWFEATVIRTMAKQRCYSVVYDSLIEEDAADPDVPKPLREVVESRFVRPRQPPPPLGFSGFTVNQLVDAYHNDGWWVGYVLEVCQAEEGGTSCGGVRYHVWFPYTREKIVFGARELRVHLDWVDCEWVAPQRKSIEVPKLDGSRMGGLKKHTSAISRFPEIQLPETEGESMISEIHTNKRSMFSGGTKTPSGEKTEFVVDTLTPVSQATKKFKSSHLTASEPLSRGPSKESTGGCEVQKTPVNNLAAIESKVHWKSKKSSAKRSRISQKIINSASRISQKMINSASVTGQNTPPIKRRGRPPKVKCPTPQSNKKDQPKEATCLAAGNENKLVEVEVISCSPLSNTISHGPSDGKVSSGGCLVQRTFVTEATKEYIVLALESKVLRKPKKLVARRPCISQTDMICGSLTSEINQKDQLDDMCCMAAGSEHNVDKADGIAKGISDQSGCLVNQGACCNEDERMSAVAEGQCQMVQNEDYVARVLLEGFGRKQLGEENSVACEIGHSAAETVIMGELDDAPVGVQPTVCKGEKDASVVSGQQTTLGADGIVNTVLHDICSETTSVSLNQEAIDASEVAQLMEVSEGHVDCLSGDVDKANSVDNVMFFEHSQPVVKEGNCPVDNGHSICQIAYQIDGKERSAPSGENPQSENAPLPFVKTSSLWESIESMEVFRTTMQQPHFRPLEQCPKEFREGNAIGIMVNFANLVSSVTKLKINDAQDDFDEKLEALVKFEEHGFNVNTLSACLKNMASIRGSQGALGEKITSLECHMAEKEDELSRISKETDEIDKELEELERSISLVREKRSSIMMMKEKIKSDMITVQEEISAVKHASVSTEHAFKVAITSLW